MPYFFTERGYDAGRSAGCWESTLPNKTGEANMTKTFTLLISILHLEKQRHQKVYGG